MSTALEELKRFNREINDQINYVPTKSSINPLFELRALMSQLKEAETFLQEAENKFQRVFYESSIPKVIIGINDHILAANVPFTKMTGYSEKELIDRDWYDLIKPEFVQEAITHKETLKRGGIKYYHSDKIFISKDGKEINAFVNVVVVDSYVEKPLFYLMEIIEYTHFRDRFKKFQDKISEYERAPIFE